MKNRIMSVTAAAITLAAITASAEEAGTTQTAPASTTTLTSGGAPSQAADPSLTPPVSTRAPTRETVELHQTTRPNRPLLYTGGAMLVGTYATTAALTATGDLDKNLYIPVVGPWVHLADQPDNATTMDSVLAAGSGVLQGAGAILTLASFLVPERIPAATIEAKNVKIHFSPTAYGRASAGFGAIGTF